MATPRRGQGTLLHSLVGDIIPGKPGSEDTNAKGVWDARTRFMDHLYWQKPRLVTLGPKIEVFPDEHLSKAQCLYDLSRPFDSIENLAEPKRLLTHTLKLWGEHGDDR